MDSFAEMWKSFECHGASPVADQLVDVDRLILHDPTIGVLDLGDASVRSVVVDGIHAPLTVRVSPSLEGISLAGDLASVRIEGVTTHAPLVQLWGASGQGLLEGCDWAGRLEISDAPSLDLLPLSRMGSLRELTVRNVYGPITGCSAIAAAAKLERVSFMRCYDIDVAGFPNHQALPNLTWISFDDIGAADAKVLRTRIDGFWNGHVRHARSRGWLAANTDNPFRTWDKDGAELHDGATTLWKHAQSRLTHATSIETRTAIIQDFAVALEQLCREHPLDTLRREQAAEAVSALARTHLGDGHHLARWTLE